MKVIKSNGQPTTLGIAHLSRRKKPCLVLVKDNKLVKLASFNDDNSARLFLDAMLKLTDCETKKD